jgi:polyhydroxyalkanoate synthesis repressor PhaR
MVKQGEDFVVFDAKTAEDITRSVLAQIIFEQEGKGGQSLLPITFLRQLIRFYGSSMQMLVPSYLECSLDKLTNEKSNFAEQCSAAFGAPNAFAAARPMFTQIEEQSRQNMAMFRQALSMFTPFVSQDAGQAGVPAEPASEAKPDAHETVPREPVSAPLQAREEFDEMKRQLEELQRRIEGLAPRN